MAARALGARVRARVVCIACGACAVGVPSDGMPAVDTDKINGRYRLRQEIGRGETGGVYLAEDEALKREVAIKILETTDDAERQELHFEHEIATTSQLQHPGIVTVFDRA